MKLQRQPLLLALTTLAIWMGAAILAATLQSRSNEDDKQAHLEKLSERAVDSVTERIRHYQFGLRGARAAVIAAGIDDITRESFTNFSNSRTYDQEFPGAHGFGLIRRVLPEDEAAFVDSARADDWPNFQIRQLYPHDGERFVIQYIEPVQPNIQAVGLDIASEDNRREAALTAMRTGSPALTAPITLVQAAGQQTQSFLVLMPIYRPGAPLHTAEDRERACVGWSYAPLVIKEVLRGINLSQAQLDMRLTDLAAPEGAQTFYRSNADRPAGDTSLGPTHSIDFEIYGRTWRAELAPTLVFHEHLNLRNPYELAAVLGGAGLLVSILVYLLASDKARAQRLRLTQTHRAAIVEASADAIIIESLDGLVVDWNPGAERMFGYTAKEAIGTPLASLLLPAGRAHEEDRILDNVKNHQVIRTFESTRLCKSGELLHVSIAVSPVVDANGQRTGLSKVIRDISEMRRVQQELADFNNRLENLVARRTAELDDALHDFRTIMDAVPSMIGYWDRDLINKVANKAYGQAFGKDHLAIPGMHMKSLLGREAFDQIGHHVDAVLQGSPQIFESKMPRPGQGGHQHAVSYFLPDKVGGEIRGFYVLIHDLTELTESRMKLAAAQWNSEALLETIHLHTIVSVADRAGVILDVNDSFCRISGYERDELIGKTHHIFQSGEHDAAFWADMWRTIESGESWHGEICNRTKEGSIFWVDSIISPILGADGEIEKFITIRTDITDRKRLQADIAHAHEKIEANERFLRNLTDHLPVQVAYVDKDGRFRFVNTTYCDFHHTSREEIIGRNRSEALGAFKAECTWPLFDAVLKGEAQHLEHDEDLNGEVVSVESHLIPDVSEHGVVLGVYVVRTDITERRRAERELHDTMTLLNAVLDAASQVAIVAGDRDGKITVFNTGAERLLGYNKQDVLGQHYPSLVHDAKEMEERAVLLSEKHDRRVHVQEVLSLPEELGQTHEWSYICADGSHVPVQMGVTAMYDEGHGLCGYLAVAYDKRQQKEQERSLREAVYKAKKANQAKTLFLANMSHEIRTPMNAVIGLSYLLERTRLDGDQSLLLSKIKVASKSLLSLINNVLDLSKIEAAELNIEHSDFRIDALLQEIADLTTVQSDAKGIEFSYALPPDLPPTLTGDATRLRQVLVNLLTNAVKFTPVGEVTLAVETLSRVGDAIDIKFSITDTGIGMTEEEMARLFTPFAQADASTTRKYGGTGLGLSIVKELVELMGGELGLESQPGAGSTFWVKLPFVVSQNTLAAPSLMSAHMLRDGLDDVRVLVVDDSEINLEVARRVLEMEGAVVSLAMNGQEALTRLRSSQAGFDIVLMDLQMPVMDGFDACHRIREELKLDSIPVIALSASTLNSEIERAKRAGVNDFVTKPFDADQLVRCIRRWLGRTTNEPTTGWGSTEELFDEGLDDKPPSNDGQGTHGVDETPERPEKRSKRDDRPRSKWPEIAGINGDEARTRLGDDRNLFKHMLKRLVSEFSDLENAQGVPDAQSLPALAGRLHKLKGTAATLGAASLAEAAAAADQVCRSGDASGLDVLLVEVRHQLALLSEAIRTQALDEAVESCHGELIGSDDLLTEAFDEQALVALMDALRQNDLEALQRVTDMAAGLQRRLGPVAYGRLREQVDNLDFHAALQTLQDAHAT